jgi:hypothetical protein
VLSSSSFGSSCSFGVSSGTSTACFSSVDIMKLLVGWSFGRSIPCVPIIVYEKLETDDL